MTVGKTGIRHVGLVDIVAGRTWEVPLMAQPVALHLRLETALSHRVAGQLGKRALRELVNLREVIKIRFVASMRNVNLHAPRHCIPPGVVPL